MVVHEFSVEDEKDSFTKEEVVGLCLGEGLPHLAGVGLLAPALEGENLQPTSRTVWVPDVL